MPDNVLLVAEVAKVLKLSEKSVYAMVKDGKLPCFRLGSQWRVRESDLNSWMAQQVNEQTNQKGKS